MLTLDANGRPATFNKGAFHHLLHEISKSNHINIGDLEEQLGRAVYKSKDTIHKWHTKGPVGPDTFDSVERLAIALNLSSPAPLLHFTDGGNRSMDQLNERQINAAKRIYDMCIWFLNEFDHSNGFRDLWAQFAAAGSQAPKADTCRMIKSMWNKVELVLDQEYFDLRGCEVYDEFCEFIYEDLHGIYLETLNSTDCFAEQAMENPDPYETYDRAMTRLNTIIETYI